MQSAPATAHSSARALILTSPAPSSEYLLTTFIHNMTLHKPQSDSHAVRAKCMEFGRFHRCRITIRDDLL